MQELPYRVVDRAKALTRSLFLINAIKQWPILLAQTALQCVQCLSLHDELA